MVVTKQDHTEDKKKAATKTRKCEETYAHRRRLQPNTKQSVIIWAQWQSSTSRFAMSVWPGYKLIGGHEPQAFTAISTITHHHPYPPHAPMSYSLGPQSVPQGWRGNAPVEPRHQDAFAGEFASVGALEATKYAAQG